MPIALPLLMKRYIVALLFGIPLAAGCSTARYYYEPAEQATATVLGSTAARYLIPPDTRLGDVRIASFGIEEVQFSDDTEPAPALHTRFVIANDRGASDWTIDTRTIHVQFAASRPRVSPALVNSDGTGMPIITIPRGESRTIDTYHLLPSYLEGAEDVPQFDVIWQVQTDSQLVSERTPFDRHEAEPPPRTGAMVGPYPWGPWGPWYDPWLARPIIIQRITPAPRVYYYPRR